jgi:hypothetical protein
MDVRTFVGAERLAHYQPDDGGSWDLSSKDLTR